MGVLLQKDAKPQQENPIAPPPEGALPNPAELRPRGWAPETQEEVVYAGEDTAGRDDQQVQEV